MKATSLCWMICLGFTIKEILLKLHLYDFFATIRLEWIESLKFTIWFQNKKKELQKGSFTKSIKFLTKIDTSSESSLEKLSNHGENKSLVSIREKMLLEKR